MSFLFLKIRQWITADAWKVCEKSITRQEHCWIRRHRAEISPLLPISERGLNHAYDSFVSRFGPITNKLNQKILADSAALPFLLALELDYQALTNTAQKARIFSDSTVRSAGLPEEIKDCQDAFLFCLNKTGGVDLEWIAALANVSVEQAESELAGRIFWTPEGHWEIAEKYLSGNIAGKTSSRTSNGRDRATFEADD